MDTIRSVYESPKIHPTAVVDKGAEIAAGVEIGPYAVIGPHVRIGRGTRVMNHVTLDSYLEIGENCRIFPGACLGTPPQDKKFKNDRSQIVIGRDNVIREYVTVHSATLEGGRTMIGDRNFLMVGVHVAHDCQLGNDIQIANSVALGGFVKIEDRAVIGGLVGVHQFVRVGRNVMIGGISRVVQDVPPYSLCSGHPARFCGLNSVGLRRSGFSPELRSILKQVYKILYFSGLGRADAIGQIRDRFAGYSEASCVADFFEASKRGVCRPNPRPEETEDDVLA